MSKPNVSDEADRKSRRFRLSKRLAAIAIAAAFLVGVAVWGVDKWQAHRRTQAIAAIEVVGGVFTERSPGRASRACFAGPAFDDAKLASVIDRLALLRPTRIDFDQCPITDEGLLLLERLETARVVFVHETKVSPEGIERLRAALPQATVHTTKPDAKASSLMARAIYPHAVNRVAYSPADRTLVAGDGTGTLHVIDRRSGAIEHRIAAHESWLFALAFAPDGALLATGGGDDAIRLWNTNTWKLHGELLGHDDDVHGVAFSLDGRVLVSGGDDGSVRVWNLASGTLVRTLAGHGEAVTSVAVSPDGKLIASASRDDTVRLWPLESNDAPHVLRGHRDDVMTVAFHPHGNQLASVAYDRRVLLWNVAEGRIEHTLDGHADRVYSAAYRADGKTLATSAGDGTVRTWDSATGHPLQEFAGPPDISCVACPRDNGEFAASSADGNVMLYNSDIASPRRIVWTREPNSASTSLAGVRRP